MPLHLLGWFCVLPRRRPRLWHHCSGNCNLAPKARMERCSARRRRSTRRTSCTSRATSHHSRRPRESGRGRGRWCSTGNSNNTGRWQQQVCRRFHTTLWRDGWMQPSPAGEASATAIQVQLALSLAGAGLQAFTFEVKCERVTHSVTSLMSCE